MGRVFTKYNENHKGMIEMTVSQLCARSLHRSLASQITEYNLSLQSPKRYTQSASGRLWNLVI